MLIKSRARELDGSAAGGSPLDDGYLDRTPYFQFILLSLLFPMWGAAAGLNDILIPQFKQVFELSDAAAAFVQSAFYGGYFLIAILASRFIKRTSYKAAVMVGLVLYIVGCWLFFPASHMATYSVFLVAIFAIAVGLSFLETSANTYSSMLGPRRTSTLRLNISQTFTPLGNLAGIILGKYLVFDDEASLEQQIQQVEGAERQALVERLLGQTLLPYKYILVVLVVLLVLFAITQYPRCRPKAEVLSKKAQATVGETLKYLSTNARFLKGIGAQFMYVGLQTAVWSFTIRLALETHPGMNEFTGANYMIFGFIAFFIGKFPANFLMSRFSPAHVLIAYGAIGAVVLAAAAVGPAQWAIWGVIAANLLMGPCWPTIFGRTLDTIEDKRYQETGGAILVMAIVGGAVIPAVQGVVSDVTGSLQVSFLVGAVCFAVIMLFFLDQARHTRTAGEQEPVPAGQG
ncbi:L-fucose:H+ symporter permease [Saccharopolyspora rhizosphaerae]|uniref:L-fucose:H+ symporter permease n=1 Tax=Saccharopolyspora rhizosphaerae TaxID=2492662 RepID=A0A3R8QLG6_9PSEU|nr:L-fucose:H+ symporter permease [Saccharopolyspora rhizosphaerae]RRO15075.1 L-fucose:H+ symporter permease [Saccharopolyspora rhizosphaerae]